MTFADNTPHLSAIFPVDSYIFLEVGFNDSSEALGTKNSHS